MPSPLLSSAGSSSTDFDSTPVAVTSNTSMLLTSLGPATDGRVGDLLVILDLLVVPRRHAEDHA
jgi:hypothetical protein